MSALMLSVTTNNLLVETIAGFTCLFLYLYQHFAVHCTHLSLHLKIKRHLKAMQVIRFRRSSMKMFCVLEKFWAANLSCLCIYNKATQRCPTADCIHLAFRHGARMVPLGLPWVSSNEGKLLIYPNNSPSHSATFVRL